MKKFALGFVLVLFSLGLFTYAGNIEFSPTEGSFGKGCIFGVDININTENADIAAFDMIMETSMKFYDFVPSELFPYYLPPVVKGNVVHLVGFTTNPNNWINGNGSVGKIYFKSNPEDSDGSVRLYFVGEGDTTDSNLSIPGGVDTLTSVKDGYYTFTADGECLQEHDIIGGYNGISYQSGLDMVVGEINSDFKKLKMSIFWERIGAMAVLLIIIILIILYLHKKGYFIRYKTKKANN